MSENQVLKTVQINGDKNGFNSKTAVDKFKQAVKLNNNFDLVELSKRFVRDGYQLDLENSLNDEYTFNIKQVITPPTNSSQTQVDETAKRRELLKAKIHSMNQLRTSEFSKKTKSGVNVPEDILSEYKKLVKVSKLPIPEPSEVLSNPEKYKSIISMVLENSMLKSLPQFHPYIKYCKLIAKQLGIDESTPNVQIPNNLEQMMKMVGPVTDIKGNTISKDADTDSEDESN
jgi:hypothetical protein